MKYQGNTVVVLGSYPLLIGCIFQQDSIGDPIAHCNLVYRILRDTI
jgi:hypothetical protein